ncbi:MAG: response regulator [Chloroflexi bacterium]|nr:MAG: response regulator [Chloroflexota bacterium]TMF55042.1 MAG: response regulator [Chloroflexota bacterium]
MCEVVIADPTRVLVVEDDDELRGLIGAALADAGYAASEASDGAAALAVCRERDPDLILLDLALPRLGGQAFADAYRSGPGRAKIIVMSGTTSAGETSGRIHAAAFLSKPFDVETLLGAVRRVVPPATL